MKKTKKNIIKNNSNLSNIDQRYCRCLIKVLSKKINSPYAICTNSVYNLQNKKRNKVVNCVSNYNFTHFSKNQLSNYANKNKYYKK